MALEPQKKLVGHVFGKVITGQLRALAAVVRAVIDELEKIELPGAVVSGLPAVALAEVIPERVSRQA
jgi:hypothetical protein